MSCRHRRQQSRRARTFFSTLLAEAATSGAGLLGVVPAVGVPALLLLTGPSLWPTVAGYHAFCIGVPLLARRRLSDLGLAGRPSRGALIGSIAAAALLIAAGAAVAGGPKVSELLPSGWVILLARLRPWWAFAAYSICFNPLIEEIFWRGFLLPHSGRIAGSLLFYLMHFTALGALIGPVHAVWITLPALAAGFLWGWLRESAGSLWPCVITHLGADAGILIAATALRPTPAC